MKKNIGRNDRIVRISFAVIVAVLYFTGAISGTLAIVLGVLSAVFIATSFLGFCPIYWGTKINTLMNKFEKNK